MKRRILVCATVGALCCLVVLAAAPVVLHNESARAPSAPRPGDAPSNLVVIPSPGSNLLLLALAPARKSAYSVQPFLPTARSRPPSASPTIPAGVYKTVPFSCIVVVPGPHPDDRCIFGQSRGESSMPIIKPDLRFIPWNAAK